MRAGALREVVVIETPEETRNDVGEFVRTWKKWRTVRASVEPVNYTESVLRQQTGGQATHTVRTRWFPGLTAAMRLRWESRSHRILWVSAFVERGHRQEYEITVEERANA